MSLLLWSKEITLVLLVGVSCGANKDCKTIPSCEMDCDTRPKYRCNRRGIIEVPSFPEATEEMHVTFIFIETVIHHNFSRILYNMPYYNTIINRNH